MALGPIFGVLFDGFAYGMLLFLLSVGLSVTLGMMNFVNLAHCAFAMLGGYVTVTLMNVYGWPFLATLPLAFLAAAAASVAFERTLYRRLYRAGELDQVLLTIGLAFMSVAAAAYFFGTVQQPVADAVLSARLHQLSWASRFGAYRLFLVATGLTIALLLALTLEYTRFGAQVRAAVDNQRMARGLGINVEAAFAITFALGSGLAGLGGALAIEIVGLDPALCLHLPRLRADRGFRRRARLDRRVLCRRRRCSASATWPASTTFPRLGAFLIYLVMVAFC